jgi:hypothetical protein
MSYVDRSKVWLSSRRSLDKGDLEGVFTQIVKLVGGSYYVNGVATGPVAGILDRTNFTNSAGITNAQKTNNGAYVMLCADSASFGTINAGVSVTFTIPSPLSISGIWPANFTQGAGASGTGITLAGFGVSCASMSSATNAGTAALQYVDQTGTVATVVTRPWTNVGTASPILVNWTLAPTVPVLMTYSFNVTLNPTTANCTAPVIQLMFRIPHLKGM